MSTTVTDTIKLDLGIEHAKLDGEIDRLINVGKADMKRAGVLAEKVELTDDSLINQAIVSYVCWHLASDEQERNLYERSYRMILQDLKDSAGYRTWGENNA